MPSDLSTLDLATLSAAESAILVIIRSQCCQWEQESADSTAAGNLSTALLLKHWADAADLLTLTVITEFSGFFGQVANARIGITKTTAATRSAEDLAVQVASEQEEPLALSI